MWSASGRAFNVREYCCVLLGVGCVIFCDFAFIKLAVVNFFTDDGTNRMEASRLGSCSLLGGGWERRDRHVPRGLHPWSCDTLLHPWSCITFIIVFFIIIIIIITVFFIIIIILDKVFFIIIILVKVE